MDLNKIKELIYTKQLTEFIEEENADNQLSNQEFDQLNEVSKYDAIVTYYRSMGLDPYKLRGVIGKQLRDKIKQSPAFHAWAKLHNYENVSYNPNSSSLVETIKAAKKNSSKKVEVKFYGYPDKDSTISDSEKDEAKTDDNFITPN